MSVNFLPPTVRWATFYERYGLVLDVKPNEAGWININCTLPSHRGQDKERRGAVNVFSGSYRCWKDSCRDEYVHLAQKKNPNAQILTPREWLIVAIGVDPAMAASTVESYRLQSIYEDNGESGAFGHEDKSFSNAMTTFPPDILDIVREAQASMTEDLPIVAEYMESRGLQYQTLVDAGIGFLEGDESQEECLLIPYFLNGQVVGIRGRTIDGRKGGIKNSYQTLYNLDAISEKARTCIIVEGETDTLYLTQVLKANKRSHIPVLGTPGVNFKLEWKRHLQQFTRVIAIPQADEAAQRFQRNLQLAFPETLEVCLLPWKPRQSGKDISDFCRAGRDNEWELLQLLGLHDQDTDPLPYMLSDSHMRKLAKVEVPWIIPDVLERGTKVIIVGPPKSRKTWIALDLARAVAQGSPFMNVEDWRPAKKGRVVFVEEEGSNFRLAQRWTRMCPSPVEGAYFIHRQTVRLDVPESLSQLKQSCLQAKPDVIVFDPYAALHSQDENQVQGTMHVMAALNSLMRALPNAAVVLIHHTSKDELGPRGSSALWGAVDGQIRVYRLGNTNLKLVLEGRDIVPSIDLDTTEFVFNPTVGTHSPQEIAAHVVGRSKLHHPAPDDELLENRPPGLIADPARWELNEVLQLFVSSYPKTASVPQIVTAFEEVGIVLPEWKVRNYVIELRDEGYIEGRDHIEGTLRVKRYSLSDTYSHLKGEWDERQRTQTIDSVEEPGEAPGETTGGPEASGEGVE